MRTRIKTQPGFVVPAKVCFPIDHSFLNCKKGTEGIRIPGQQDLDEEADSTVSPMEGKLTVYFEDPFWVGVFERVEDGKLSVCKVTFGAEPKDYEVWKFVLQHYYELEFSPAVETGIKRSADNPKRRQRNARKQLERTGIGTKSQQAL